MAIKAFAAIYSGLVFYLVKNRLNLAQEDLSKEYESIWTYRFPLLGGDAIRFFPYTILPGEMDVQYEEGQDIKHWKPPRVMDPINIIAYGMSRNEFIKLLKKGNAEWKQILGTCQFLQVGNKWHSSIAVKIDIDKKRGERYHIRLFEVKTRKNNTVTICAAHRDEPKNEKGKHPAPRSFNEPRDVVMRDLAGLNLKTYLIGPITERDFRGVESDGKILFVASG